jgi:DNA-binding response OmpR family regulator
VADERTVVVIEDDAHIADLLDLYLREAGFRVLQAGTGERGLALVAQHQAVLVVLDIGLPDIDGFEVCRRIRATTSLPVMFLTARDGEIDRVLGLELGADDYVVKPFSPREVVARVKAILRRGQPVAGEDATTVRIGDDFEVDTARREVSTSKSSPMRTTDSSAAVAGWPRRRIAFTRAITSRGENGLTT